MSPVVLIVLIAVLAVPLSAWLGVNALQRRARSIRQQWIAESVILLKGPENANYRGHIGGKAAVRGNGVIGLTDSDLRFAQLIPRRELRIPLAHITRVARRGSVTGMMPMAKLVVYYRDGEREDGIGLIVKDPQGWMDAIAAAANVPVEGH